MLREQAIFFEVHEDLYIHGSFEAQIFAYHDFITGFDFASATDLQIHSRAVECLKRYENLLRNSKVNFYDMRWEVLEKLDLDDAKWEHRDQVLPAKRG